MWSSNLSRLTSNVLPIFSLMPLIKFIATTLITVFVILALDTRMGGLPAAGRFLSPFHGFWQNAETQEPPAEGELRLVGLLEPVTVVYDERRVPHVFAQNDRDLFFAQGYITARDRLWQMEFQTKAAAGRLAEILGTVVVERDRYQRRIGLVHGARNTLKDIMAEPETHLSVSSYSNGVNAFIGGLRERDYPIEYKLLGYSPEPWTPLKCAILIKSMARILSARTTDLRMDNTLDRFGEEVVRDLFSKPFGDDTVIPPGTPWDFEPRKVIRPETKLMRGSIGTGNGTEIGSNNWAVSGTRTASGYPILANDPHLGLSLPSLWYEIQLVGPALNVYGVSLPGGPGVVIGFNRSIAWGLTNAGTDVSDWYEITFRDDTLQEYRHGDRWRPVETVIEEIEVRGGETIQDTVRYTHHGPVVWDSDSAAVTWQRVPSRHAFRWVAHDGGNEWLTCHRLNAASGYDDFVEALSHLNAPAQNFAYADVEGNIAIWHNGKFPVRWEGQGVFLADGSNPLHDWQDWIPHAHKPHIKNPARGFVSSANQRPVDAAYPYWLADVYSSPTRARRINERLSEMKDITPDDFRALQLDTQNLHARSVLPVLLTYIEPGSLKPDEGAIYQVLKNWDYFSDADEIAPSIFYTWWKELHWAIWKDELALANVQYPSRDRTVKLILSEPDARWYDNTRTEPVETLADLARRAFESACTELTVILGPMGDSWKWGRYRGADIRHLLKIPEFSRMDLFVGGGRGIVNATNRRHGPCWRMVVSLGPEVRAWGIYPGGQSGNPGSRHYDDFVDTWVRGELDELLFMKTPEDGQGRVEERLTLVKKP